MQSIRTAQHSYKGSRGGSIAISIAPCPNYDGDSHFEGILPAEQGDSHDHDVRDGARPVMVGSFAIHRSSHACKCIQGDSEHGFYTEGDNISVWAVGL